MDVSQIKWLKVLEDKNRELKQMYSNLALENRILKDVIENNFRAREQEVVGKRDCREVSSQHRSDVQDDREPKVL